MTWTRGPSVPGALCSPPASLSNFLFGDDKTQAELESASAKYDYETQLSALNYQIGVLH